MKPIQISRTIAAPMDLVFRTVSDIRTFRKAVPHITHVEFLSDQRVGAGTRFRETRWMNGREHTVELEVAEYIDNDRVRMISDAGGRAHCALRNRNTSAARAWFWVLAETLRWTANQSRNWLTSALPISRGCRPWPA